MNPTSVRNLLLSMGLAAGIGGATNGCSSQGTSPGDLSGTGGLPPGVGGAGGYVGGVGGNILPVGAGGGGGGFGNGLGGYPSGGGGVGGNGNILLGGAPGTQDASADTGAQGDDATDAMSTDNDAAQAPDADAAGG